MRKWIIRSLLVALPVAICAGAVAHRAQAASENPAGYICPITGEVLPCPACCPLGQTK
jgi:hypothetical protein